MASLEAQIDINFNNTISKAGELEDIAEELKRLAEKDFDSVLQTLSGNWTGENASAYISKGLKLEEELKDSSSEIAHIAGALRSSAKRIHDAEMKALEFVKEIKL